MAIVTKTNTTVQNLFDLATGIYGNISYVFKLIEDNSEITDIATIITAGMEITYDDSIVFETPKVIEAEQETISVSTITIKENQSLYDMSIQMYGSIDYIFQVLQDNPVFENVNVSSLVGIDMIYQPQTFAITEFFKTNRIFITTGSLDGRSFDDSFSFSFN